MNKVKLVSVNIAVLLFLLILVELVLRVSGLGYGDEPLEQDRVFHHVFPADYRFVQYHPTEEFGGFEVYYNQDRRISNPKGEPVLQSGTKPRIVLLGDSFVVGKEVPWEKSFAGILQKTAPGLDMENYAVTSHSPSIYYLQLKALILAKRPGPVGIFLLLYSNDVSNDSSYLQNAHYDHLTGELTALDGGENSNFISLLRKSFLVRWVRKKQIMLSYQLKANKDKTNDKEQWVAGGFLEQRPALAGTATEVYLLKIKALLSENNIPFCLSAVPSKYCHFTRQFELSGFDQTVKIWAAENGVPYLDLTHDFNSELELHGNKCFFEKDIHFNESGHAVTAKSLLAYFQNEWYLPIK